MSNAENKKPEVSDKAIARLNTDYLCFSGSFDGPEGDTKIVPFDEEKQRRETAANFINQIAETRGRFSTVLDNALYQLWINLRHVSNYFAGEFVPYTSDEDFLAEALRIWPTLIDKWYFGECYLAYGETYLEAEKLVFKRHQKKDWWESKNFPESKLRIYVRESKGKFRSVLTNTSGLDLDPNELVYCSCNSTGLYNFVQWVRIWLDWFNVEQAGINAFRGAMKQNICKVAAKSLLEDEQEQLKNLDIALVKKTIGTHEQNIYKQYPMFPLDGILTVYKAGQYAFDLKAKYLGMYPDNMSNDNDHDRVTMGEHIQAMKLVDNVQMSFFNSLKSTFLQFKKKFKEVPKDLEIVTNKMQLMGGVYNAQQNDNKEKGPETMQNNI